MAKKRARTQKRKTEAPPKTIGELRRLLAKRGDPWRPDPRLSDDEPIPRFPTGGDGTRQPPGVLLREGELIELLKREPPSNPFLRELWKERGLLEERAGRARRAGKRRSPRGSG